MNAIIATISLPYRLLILLGFIFISVILAFYSFYKKQHKMTFFDKNVNVAVKDLESNINELENWYEYIKIHVPLARQELKRVIGIISLNFLPTDRKSEIDKSIGDSYPKILLFLRDYKPNSGNDIKTQYNNIIKQMVDIEEGLLYSSSEQTKLPFAEVLELKNRMEKLVETLQGCVEIAKEERE